MKLDDFNIPSEHMDFLTEALSPVMEYYAGKSSFLIDAEKHLLGIKQLIMSNTKAVKKNSSTIQTSITHNSLNKNLCSSLEKAFGISDINIYWYSGTVNACTLPPILPTTINKTRSNVEKGKKTNVSMNIIVYTDLFSVANLSEREALAIILHEIGHNLYMCPLLCVFKLTVGLILSPIQLLLKFIMIDTVSKIDDYMRTQVPGLYNLFDSLNKFLVDNLTPIIRLGNLVDSILLKLIPFQENPELAYVGFIPDIAGYGGEKGSDSFAARCGYGPEMITSMHKITELPDASYHSYTDNNIFGTIDDLVVITQNFMNSLTDAHPSINSRYHGVMSKLKSDLKNGNYPPELKPQLEAQIKELEEVYDRLNKTSEKDKDTLKTSVAKFLDKVTFNHPEYREILNPYYNLFRF